MTRKPHLDLLLAVLLILGLAQPLAAEGEKPAPRDARRTVIEPGRVYTNTDLPAPPELPVAEPAEPAEPPAPPPPRPGAKVFTNDDLPQPPAPVEPPPPAVPPTTVLPPAAPTPPSTPTLPLPPTAPAARGKVYTNADLPAPPPAPPAADEAAPAAPAQDDSGAAAPAPATGDSAIETTALTYDNYLDRQGNGRAWWQARLRERAAALARAEQELQRAEEENRRLLRAFDDRRALPPGTTGVADAARVRAAQAELQRAQGQLDGLFDEARRAGALPGWLRESAAG